MVVFPNAKINIGLNVVRKREDGFHDIETLMVPVQWCDVLEIVESRENSGYGDKIQLTGFKVDCPVEKNLVIKAVRAVRKYVDNSLPCVEIYLHKNIPDGAGLGGGSSDAAFTIKALDTMFQLGLDLPQMAEIAAVIGSDCPFFIYNEPMLATGRGEILTPTPLLEEKLKDLVVVVARPEEEGVSTAEAYSGVTIAKELIGLRSLIDLPIAEWKTRIYNCFEASVFPAVKSSERLKSQMYSLGAVYASMSGSGSAVYGLFEKAPLDLSEARRFFQTRHVYIG